MDHVLLVHVVESSQDLLDQVCRVFIVKLPVVSRDLVEDLQEITIFNQLHDEVNVLFIFEQLVNVHNMGMVELLEHLEL